MSERNAPIAPRKMIGKVLIVEDDTELGRQLKADLQSTGLECEWVSSLEDAQKEFKSRLYHAVVTDIYLDASRSNPGGLDLIRSIEASGVPSIVMSSAADLKIAKEAMNHGAIYLFEKPFEVKELVKVLEKAWAEPRGMQVILERFLDQYELTNKEKEIVRLLVKGLSNKEMANIEGNTDRTIKFHLTSIFQKCGVASRTELFNAIFPT